MQIVLSPSVLAVFIAAAASAVAIPTAVGTVAVTEGRRRPAMPAWARGTAWVCFGLATGVLLCLLLVLLLTPIEVEGIVLDARNSQSR